jgi:hypothetical protein
MLLGRTQSIDRRRVKYRVVENVGSDPEGTRVCEIPSTNHSVREKENSRLLSRAFCCTNGRDWNARFLPQYAGKVLTRTQGWQLEIRNPVLGKRGSILRYEAQETDSGEQSPNRELKPNAGWVDENVGFPPAG